MMINTIIHKTLCLHIWIYSLNFYDMKLNEEVIIERTDLMIFSCFGRNDQQDLFNVLGSMFTAIIFFGINNCSTVIPLVATERTVLCRERFAGMYSSWAYSLAQVRSSCENRFNIIPIKFIKTLNMVMKSSCEINLRTIGSPSRSIFFVVLLCLITMKLTFCSM